MKSLILFDSTFGNTKIIAETIASEFGKDVKTVSISDFKEGDLKGINLLVVGSPIVGWSPTEKMGKFLAGLGHDQLKGMLAAAFDTRMKIFFSGDVAKKIAAALKAAGAHVIVEPKGFFVKGREGPLFDGEVEKARAWAQSIKSQAVKLGN